jgi:pyridoxine 5-phosphate synthase
MKKIRLGVNIDHVATIRNARGEYYPEPFKAAEIVEKSGANSVTIHLREDRRHIRDYDLKKIKNKIKIPLNLEMAPTTEMLKIAIKTKPNYVCIVPENRKEITTEGGLNLNRNTSFLRKIINKLKSKKIRVSLFVEPRIRDIKKAKLLDADCVELHTGKYCSLSIKNKSTRDTLLILKKTASYASKSGLEVHAGHGLTYKSARQISKIKEISELNIGHFIISDSIFVGLKNSIRKFKKIINS